MKNARPVSFHPILLLLGIASFATVAPLLQAQEEVTETAPAPLAPPLLQNATYDLPGYGRLTLADGQYRDRERGMTAVLDTTAFEFGDLDGNGSRDAAAIVTLTPDREGQPLTYLVTLANTDGAPQPLAATFLGRDLQVRSVDISRRRVQLELLLFGPQDPLCCPSELVTQSYRFNTSTQRLEIATIAESRDGLGRDGKFRIDFDASSGSSDPNLGDRDFRGGAGVRFPL